MTAVLLPNAKQQFLDGNGAPLASGSVYFYVPSTSTPKNTWQDAGQSILNTNPVTLDASGEAIIYGSGQYRQVVYDALGNLIWDELTADITSTLQAAGIVYCGTSTGSANAQILSPDPTITELQIGQLLAFTAGFTNTNTMTIEVSAIPVAQVYYGGSVAPARSVIVGSYILIEWDGTHFQLANQALPSYAANTFVANATAGTATPIGIALALNKLAGRGSSGNIAQISIGSHLSMTGTTLDAIVVSAGTYQAQPSNPTATTSTTGVMMGLAGSITCYTTGTAMIIISGTARNSAADGCKAQIYVGAGALAPSNGDALTGSALGSRLLIQPSVNDAPCPFSLNGIITGLTLGVPYWIDIGFGASTGGTSTAQTISISAFEIK